MREVWPMIGRAGEFRAAVESVGSGGGVVVVGSTGVGKTRLAREVLAERQSQGWSTEWVTGTVSAKAIPFGAFAPLLPVLGTNRRAPARDILDVFLLARQAILDRSADRPFLLVIDDAHLLDEASALLAFHLASATEAISVVLTVCDGEAAPDAVTALWKEGLAERLYLRPLSRASVTKLLEAALGGQVDGLLSHEVWKASGGILLYLNELIEAAQGKGRLGKLEGVWRLSGPLVAGDRLLGLIEARLRAVPARSRRGLEAVAVGEPVDLETLGQLSLLADTEEGERRGLLTWETEGGRPVVRLAHALYAEALLRRMPASRRRSIVHDLADAYAETGADRGEGLLRYVNWRLEIGEAVPPGMLLEGARRAVEAMDLRLAERLALASVDAGGDSPARIFLAGVHYRQGRGVDALADLDGMHPRDEVRRTEITALRVSILLWALGRAQDAEDALDCAIEATKDRDCRAWLAAIKANVSSFGGYPAEAVAIAAPLAGDADLSPRPVLSALSALGPGLALSGRGDEAVRIAERRPDPALRAADQVGGSMNWAVGTLFLAHLGCGRLREAEDIARLQYETALSLRSHEAHGAGATSLGWVALVQGRVASAARSFREAEPHLRHADLLGIRTACLGGLAQALALAGDEQGAAEVLCQAETSARPGVRWLDSAVDLGRAWTCSIGDRAAAAGMCLKAGDTAHDRGQLPFAVIAFHDAARLGAADEAASSLRAAAGGCDGPFPRAALAHVEALTAGDDAGLLTAADAFEDLGMFLLAGEAVVEAQHFDPRQNHRRRTARAAALVARCEGAMTPTLADRVKEPVRLTDRELAVAHLASEGHSSRAIARQLSVSVRTVDSHLAHAYRKLGVLGRQELAAVISSVRDERP